MATDLEEINAVKSTQEPNEWAPTVFDARELLQEGKVALEESRGNYLRRKAVRRSIRRIHNFLNPDIDDPSIETFSTDTRIEILTLLSRLHTEYANIMTMGGFSQYGDVSHVDGAGIYSVSAREIIERNFAILLAEGLMDMGVATQELVDCRDNNYWILRERLYDDVWQTLDGKAKIADCLAEAQSVAERYLPESKRSPQTDLGLSAVRQALAA